MTAERDDLDESYTVTPIGFVECARDPAEEDDWGHVPATIVLAPPFTAEALQGLDAFSHIEVLFLLHQVDPARIVTGTRHPRNNPAWPAVGIFAQRVKRRPNRLASTICRVVRIDDNGTPRIHVTGLDAIDGTPVLDIKPVMIEFQPREAITQPAWATELMRAYWQQP
jgi:tRNA (adenine37-N6)-methyltransferase